MSDRGAVCRARNTAVTLGVRRVGATLESTLEVGDSWFVNVIDVYFSGK